MELNFYLEISNSVSPISLLPHVPVHVLKPVDPALELDEVRSMGLDCEMDRRLSLGHIVMSSSSRSWLTSLITIMAYLVDHYGEPVLCQRGNITENASPKQGMTEN